MRLSAWPTLGMWVMVRASGDAFVGLRLRTALGRLRQRAHDGAARQFDLEAVVALADGALQQALGHAAEQLARRGRLFQQRFRGWHAPRSEEHTSELQS